MSTGTLQPQREKQPGRQAAAAARRGRDQAMTVVLAALVAIAVAVLVWVLVYVAEQGLKYLGPAFFTSTPPGNPASYGGGYANGIVGSLIVVGIATAISVPIGIAAAIAIVEYGGRIAAMASFITDVLVGVPTIATGAFIYAVMVVHLHHFSGLAGSVALAIVMLPLVIRATAEIIRLVPVDLREASAALGISRARTIVSVVLPSASSGIITGIFLAVARAMGETAPLLLTALGDQEFMQVHPTQPMSTLSLQIFTDAISGFQAGQARAWAGALTLIILVLLFAVSARFISRRATITRS